LLSASTGSPAPPASPPPPDASAATPTASYASSDNDKINFAETLEWMSTFLPAQLGRDRLRRQHR
jgi:hypothetical protein